MTKFRRFGAKEGTAIALVALLFGTFVLPAYAKPASTTVTAKESQSPSVQSLNVSDQLLASATTIPARENVSVIKVVPESASYSRIADTFTNVSESPIQWPFLVGVPISSWFGYRSCDGCPVFHKGIDINPGLGTPIQAIADGVVTELGANDADYGTNVVITHQIDGQTISSRYAHMIEGSSPLAVGDVVAVGDLVGQVGNTGISTGAHLHFEILLNGVTPTDPYVWLKEKIGS
ncbi:MAG: M23 family metallopeptidase [Rhodoglobus sp.]